MSAGPAMRRFLKMFRTGWQRIETDGQSLDIHFAMAGEGPPLLLLHGFPETHLMWHAVACDLAAEFTVICPDLRGYGRSSVPGSEKGAAYTKRLMAKDQVALMQALGFEAFSVAGHDRGGRVAYRLALDYPALVSRLAVIDIAPTIEYFDAVNKDVGLRLYHWFFLAQPADMPERLIGGDADFYIRWTMDSWAGTSSVFDPHALAEYVALNGRPANIHAMCEDYRAGAGEDCLHDEEDRNSGRVIGCPTLALWGAQGIAQATAPLEIWRRWAGDVTGQALDCGHFVPEEAPDETLSAMLPFFRGTGL